MLGLIVEGCRCWGLVMTTRQSHAPGCNVMGPEVHLSCSILFPLPSKMKSGSRAVYASLIPAKKPGSTARCGDPIASLSRPKATSESLNDMSITETRKNNDNLKTIYETYSSAIYPEFVAK